MSLPSYTAQALLEEGKVANAVFLLVPFPGWFHECSWAGRNLGSAWVWQEVLPSLCKYLSIGNWNCTAATLQPSAAAFCQSVVCLVSAAVTWKTPTRINPYRLSRRISQKQHRVYIPAACVKELALWDLSWKLW